MKSTLVRKNSIHFMDLKMSQPWLTTILKRVFTAILGILKSTSFQLRNHLTRFHFLQLLAFLSGADFNGLEGSTHRQKLGLFFGPLSPQFVKNHVENSILFSTFTKKLFVLEITNFCDKSSFRVNLSSMHEFRVYE